MESDPTRRPSAKRLHYMIEMEKLEKADRRYGFLSKVAVKCGVNVSAVSRWMKMCMMNGYLTEEYELTPVGREWFDYYLALYHNLKRFLRAVRVPEEKVEGNAEIMFNQLDEDVLQDIMANTDIRQKQTPIRKPPGRGHVSWET